MVKKHDAKNIYCISIPIIITTVISLTPSLVVDYGSIRLDYRWNHVITIFFFYTISVTDPIAILIGFPPIMRYLRCQGVSVTPCDTRSPSMKRWRSAGEEHMRSLAIIKAMQQVVIESKPTVIVNEMTGTKTADSSLNNSEDSVINNSTVGSTVFVNNNVQLESDRVQASMKAWARHRVESPSEETPLKLSDLSQRKPGPDEKKD